MAATAPTARIEQIVTSGTFSLDEGTWEVDNNVWIIGDDAEVIVVDPAHDAGAVAVAVGVFVAHVAQLADGEDVHLALGAGADGPDLVARFRHVVKNAGARTVVPVPVAIVLLHHRVHVRKRIRNTRFIRHARLCFCCFCHVAPPCPPPTCVSGRYLLKTWM